MVVVCTTQLSSAIDCQQPSKCSSAGVYNSRSRFDLPWYHQQQHHHRFNVHWIRHTATNLLRWLILHGKIIFPTHNHPRRPSVVNESFGNRFHYVIIVCSGPWSRRWSWSDFELGRSLIHSILLSTMAIGTSTTTGQWCQFRTYHYGKNM